MKVYFMRNESKRVCGAQVVTEEGKMHELTTNSALNGLWRDGQQIVGTCDFSLCCCEETAKKRLLQEAVHRWFDPEALGIEKLEVSHNRPLF